MSILRGHPNACCCFSCNNPDKLRNVECPPLLIRKLTGTPIGALTPDQQQEFDNISIDTSVTPFITGTMSCEDQTLTATYDTIRRRVSMQKHVLTRDSTRMEKITVVYDLCYTISELVDNILQSEVKVSKDGVLLEETTLVRGTRQVRSFWADSGTLRFQNHDGSDALWSPTGNIIELNLPIVGTPMNAEWTWYDNGCIRSIRKYSDAGSDTIAEYRNGERHEPCAYTSDEVLSSLPGLGLGIDMVTTMSKENDDVVRMNYTLSGCLSQIWVFFGDYHYIKEYHTPLLAQCQLYLRNHEILMLMWNGRGQLHSRTISAPVEFYVEYYPSGCVRYCTVNTLITEFADGEMRDKLDLPTAQEFAKVCGRDVLVSHVLLKRPELVPLVAQ